MNERIRATAARVVLALVLTIVLAGPASSAAVVYYLDAQGAPSGVFCASVQGPVQAMAALANPAGGYTSAIPAGTQVLGVTIDGDSTIVDFSLDIVGPGLEEARLESISYQVRQTLEQFELPATVRLLANGQPLCDYLKPLSPVRPGPEALTQQQIPMVGLGTALSGKKISLSPGHGLRWGGSSWVNDRPVYCAPLDREDYHNIDLSKYLDTFLKQDGATVKDYRCLDRGFGASTYNGGEPWWHLSGSYWLKYKGYPCSIYAPSSGDCTLGSGASEDSDNISSRPRASDYDNTDIHVSVHTNGLAGDCAGMSCPNGTCTYYDNSSTHATWGAISQQLAQAVNNGIVDAIRTKYTDSSWRDRGALDAAGDFAETRIPDRAAILIELAFHDSCDRDGLYLRDEFFKSATMWGTYKGICAYFGATPSWDFYSCELVSHDIPTEMIIGQVKTVHLTFRNRGVLWMASKGFKLGAVGDTDPFALTRQSLAADTNTGDTVTFTFNLTAPSLPGTYRTDWRMLRESYAWFGPTVQQDIVVSGIVEDHESPSVPANLVAAAMSQNQIILGWSPSTDNIGVNGYKVYRNGSYIASVTDTSYSDSGLQAYTAYTYQVLAYDYASNESALSLPANATTFAVLDFIVDNPTATFLGSWTTTASSADKYGADYSYCSSAASNTKSATWTPGIQMPGYYDVSVWYPQGPNRSQKAPYTINYLGGSVTVPVNQTGGGGVWNKIATGKPFSAGTAGNVVLSNGTGETSLAIMADAVRFQFVGPSDTMQPTINSVSVTPPMVAAGDPVSVLVNAWDDFGVTQVTADGTSLTHTTGNIWTGSFPASAVSGTHPVSVVASDAWANQGADASASYVTARIMGLSCRSLLDEVVSQYGASQYLFKTWGRVTVVDSDHFDLADGSQSSVRVYCPGHGLITGDFASARGVWNPGASPRVLNCQPGQVQKLN